MRHGLRVEGLAHFGGDVHRPGQKAGRQRLVFRVLGRGENRAGFFLEHFEREVHRLEQGVTSADERSEGNEAKVPVEFFLARGAGDDRQVAPLAPADLECEHDQTAADVAVAVVLFH